MSAKIVLKIYVWLFILRCEFYLCLFSRNAIFRDENKIHELQTMKYSSIFFSVSFILQIFRKYFTFLVWISLCAHKFYNTRCKYWSLEKMYWGRSFLIHNIYVPFTRIKIIELAFYLFSPRAYAFFFNCFGIGHNYFVPDATKIWPSS